MKSYAIFPRHANKVEYAIKQAKASLAIEGMHMNPDTEELIRKRLRGEISMEEFLEIAKETD